MKSKLHNRNDSSSSTANGRNLRLEHQRILDNAMLNGCSGKEWENMLDTLATGIMDKLSQLTGTQNQSDGDGNDSDGNSQSKRHFSTLSDEDQASLVETQFQEMMQHYDASTSSSPIVAFCNHLNNAVDDELFSFILNKKNAMSDSDKVNMPPSFSIDLLTDVCAKTAVHALSTSSSQLTSTLKLFLNKPIPKIIRNEVWSFSLQKSIQEMADVTANFSKVSSSLDIIVSQRCHALLDKYFPDVSSRANAAMIKEVITKYYKLQGIILPQREEDCRTVDQLCLIITPLLVVTLKEDDKSKHTSDVDDSYNSNSIKHLVDNEASLYNNNTSNTLLKNLFAVLDKRHLGLLQGRLLVPNSEFVPIVIGLLQIKNDTLCSKLMQLSRRDRYEKYSNFEAYINDALINGMCNLFSLDTLLFVWDQAFVIGFSDVIPIVFVTAILSLEDIIKGLSTLDSICDMLNEFFHSIDATNFRRLLSKHMHEELLVNAAPEGSYHMSIDEDGILQNLYKNVFPLDSVLQE